MPEFSKITVTFLIDFEDDFRLNIVTLDTGVFTTYQWDWVASRSASFEVTTGTPTGTAGETTALNFETAYDLDLPTGFITNLLSNEIEIISETEGEEFVGFGVYNAIDTRLVLGSDYLVEFSNYIAPFDLTTVDSMLVRSPHYVTTPFYFETTTKSTIELFIWDGLITSIPATATRTITKIRPTIDYLEFNTNVSDIVKPNLEATPTFYLAAVDGVTAANVTEGKWVKYIATYTDPIEDITSVEGQLFASYGYGQYMQGINPAIPKAVLTPTSRRKMSRDGFLLIPFVNDGTYDVVTIVSNGLEVNDSINLVTSDNSEDYVHYVKLDLSTITTDTLLTVTFEYSATDEEDVYVFEILDECIYSPKTVFFRNRYGFWDCLTMFKKSIEKLNISKSQFVNNYVSNGDYDTAKHQIKDINIQGKEPVICNSGYIKENETELYKDLVKSDAVYFYEPGQFVPVRVTTTNLDYKTRINDRLINYTIDFEYAFNAIQNV